MTWTFLPCRRWLTACTAWSAVPGWVLTSALALLALYAVFATPSAHPLLNTAVFIPAGVTGAATAWRAARRSADTRSAAAWRLIGVYSAFTAAAFTALAYYQVQEQTLPFPSIADPLFLLTYPTLLVALACFPARRFSRRDRVRVGLDAATIVLSGAVVIWYFVLGPIVSTSGVPFLLGALSAAYPIGDLLAFFGLVLLIARVGPSVPRPPLQMLTAGLLLAIAGDTLFGWFALQGGSAGLTVGHILMLASSLLASLAAISQARGPVAASPRSAGTDSARFGSWLPYVAPLLVFVLLIHSQQDATLLMRASLTIAAAIVSALVAVRQILTQRDLAAATADARHQALHDALTGLPNRALILDRAERAIIRANQDGTPVAALFLDLDDFKDINDTLGHPAGDQLLRQVAERLSTTLRGADTVGRLGGDEFVVILEGASGGADPQAAAQRILDALAEPFHLGEGTGAPYVVSTSIGIATGEYTVADDLLRHADVALYQAKAEGKGRSASFETDMQDDLEDRIELENDLRTAVDGAQFSLVYQPMIGVGDESIVGVEALLRWRHPVRGVIGPEEFLPVLEATGLILPVGRWVLREACAQVAAWRRDGHAIDLSVNVSARQLRSHTLTRDIADALGETGLPPEHLVMEVSESTLMTDVDSTIEDLTALKQLGVRVAIDNFGTGYTTVACLRQFPVDMLKIDRALIEGIDKSHASNALLHTLVQLGKTLGLETVAGGVETSGQLHRVEREECDLGQGFLYSPPLPANDMGALLDTQARARPGRASGGSQGRLRHARDDWPVPTQM